MSLQTASPPAPPPETSLVQRHFWLPRGLFGRITGWFMSWENDRLNRLAVDRLAVAPGDRVLEIGFGPGRCIELLVRRTAAAHVAGVDPSPVMVEQALARNAQAVDAGRVALVLGSAEALPFAAGSFARVVAVSNLHVWQSLDAGLAEVHRVLADNGLLVVCLRRAARKKWPWTSPGVSRRRLELDQALLRAHGFGEVRLIPGRLGNRALALVARKG